LSTVEYPALVRRRHRVPSNKDSCKDGEAVVPVLLSLIPILCIDWDVVHKRDLSSVIRVILRLGIAHKRDLSSVIGVILRLGMAL
jgi:hypothetical protein